MRRSNHTAALLGAALLLACPARDENGRSTAATPEGKPAFDPHTPTVVEPPDTTLADARESAHHVVFADRTSQAYLLLLDGPSPKKPTRDELAKLVTKRMPAAKYEAELGLLHKLVAAVPPPPGFEGLPEDEKARLMQEDLLGLHIDIFPMAPQGEEPLIAMELLTEPVLTRDLSPEEHAALLTRKWAVLLRADYRNQYAVRGLRLLQTLVRVYAIEHKAFIHDPDTNETMSTVSFTRRRLKATIGNIADQIAVVPFPDDDGKMRLTTRGMRRFGSVDLELHSLPRDPAILDRASGLLLGVAYRMVREGEFNPQGFAVEADDVIDVTRRDIEQAYAGHRAKLAPCDTCADPLPIHLVERATKPTDAHEHVVARVVAPRAESDAAEYDHGAWALSAMDTLLGAQ